MRPGFVHGHGWALGSRNASRQSWAFRGENGFRRNGRFRNGGGFYGPGFWYGPYGYADAGGGGGAGGLVIVVGAPALSVFPGAPAGAADPSPEGGCVIHKLKYDGAGNYVGERQNAGVLTFAGSPADASPATSHRRRPGPDLRPLRRN